MVPDDRERVFEKALARHLRSNAPGEEHSSSTCPDAEILAAYHDRLLGPEQMLSSKEHIVGCSRCQQILAQLEATDELPVGLHVEQEQEGSDSRETQRAPVMSSSAVAEHVSLPDIQPVLVAPRSRAASRWARHLRAHPGAKWRWLAPAGLLAAGLLVWIGIHESNPPPFQLAKKQAEPAPLPAYESRPSTASPGAKEPGDRRLSERRAPAAPAPSRQDLDGAPAKRDETGELDQKVTPAVQADKLTESRPEASSKDLNALYDDANKPKAADANHTREGAREKELKKQTAPVGAPAPVANEEAQSNSTGALSETAPAAQSPVSNASAKSRAASSGAEHQQQNQQQQIGGAANMVTTQTGVVELQANARSFVTITAPDSAVLWRAARDGIIQHSTDSGSTWSIQKSGVVADLLAGSAPSDQICWMVGRSGTVVRTTDGGQNWRKMASPVASDLVSVFAVDAQQATVTAANTAKSYKTVDGGQTWTPLSNP